MNNVQTPTFKGVKNLIFEDFKDNRIRITYLGAQLTDDENKDLTALKETLKASTTKQHHNLNDNVLTLISVELPETKEHFLTFNGEMLCSGKELRTDEKEIEKFNTNDHNLFLQEKKFCLKAYSLAAGVTKQIARLSLCDKDAGIAKVAQTLFRDFQTVFGNNINCETLLHMGFLNKKNPQQIALLFNKYIQKTMKAYFK